MSDIPEQLTQIAERLASDPTGQRETVRTLLSWFGRQKRGSYQVRRIQQAMKACGLITEPDFREVYLDSEVLIKLNAKSPNGSKQTASKYHSEEGLDEAGPTIGTMPSAVASVVSVKLQSTLEAAMTLMLINDFSQLPIMEREYNVDGLISWKSIGHALARGGHLPKLVSDCREPAPTVFKYNESLFTCIPTIIAEELVMVKGPDGKLSGLVTTTDLSQKFHELSEAFLLIGKIEILIRRLINNRFTLDELKCAKNPADTTRVVEGIADLNFGEYIHLLDNDEHWSRLSFILDRKSLMDRLKKVNGIRNEVAHFNPDGPDDADISILRTTEQFLSVLLNS